MSFRSKSVVVTIAAVLLGVSACAPQSSDPSDGASGAPAADKPQQTVKILMNYFAQAEQGGYWDAMQNQYAKADGVTLDVVQGGPGIQTIPQVASGEQEFGIGNADEVLTARKNGLPVVAIASAYDTNLFVMIAHAESDVKSFSDLNGHQVARRPAPYFDYLKSHFKLDDIEEINFTGSMADFKRNPNLIQQGFATGDVFRAQQEGIDIDVLSVAKDGGYNPYGLILFTTEKFIKESPDVVASVVQATTKGWQHFVEDPADAKKAVIAANPDSDSDTFDFSAKTIAEGDYLGSPIGKMNEERWTTLRDQLASIGQLPDDFDVSDAYTNEFLPK